MIQNDEFQNQLLETCRVFGQRIESLELQVVQMGEVIRLHQELAAKQSELNDLLKARLEETRDFLINNGMIR